MPSKNKTATIALNLWEPDDQPQRIDFNTDNQRVDDAISAAQQRTEQVNTSLGQRIDSIESAGEGSLGNAVNTLNNKIDANYNTLDGKINSTSTTLAGKINTDVATLDSKVVANYNTLDGKINTNVSSLNGTISSNYTTLNNRITNTENSLNGKINVDMTEVNEKIERAADVGARAQEMAWMAVNGLSFVNTNPTARGYLSDNLLNTEMFDWKNSGLMVQYDKTSKRVQLTAKEGIAFNYKNSVNFLSVANVNAGALIFDLIDTTSITKIMGYVYHNVANIPLTYTIYIHRYDNNDTQREEVFSQVGQVTVGSSSNVYIEMATQLTLPAGRYGIFLRSKVTSTGVATNYHLLKETEVVDEGNVTTRLIAGEGKVGTVLKTRAPFTIEYTYANHSSLRARTKHINFGAPVSKVTAYVVHSKLSGFLKASVCLPSGSKVEMIRDASYGEQIGIERFTAKIPTSQTVALELALGSGAPADGMITEYFLSVT